MKKKEIEAAVENGDGMVELKIPRGEDVYISVNGMNYSLAAGKTHRVPDYIAAEYERGQAACDRLFEEIDALTGSGESR